MKPPVVITTPMPTPEETAKLLGISKKDAKFVKALVEELVWSPEIVREFGEPLNGHASNGKRRNRRQDGFRGRQVIAKRPNPRAAFLNIPYEPESSISSGRPISGSPLFSA